MDKRLTRRDVLLLLLCFIISRVIIKSLNISFGYTALFEYWQYLDVETLRSQLLQGLWYQHSQPPVFNLLLGLILKLSEPHAPLIFEYLFLVNSFVNACLLLTIIKKVTGRARLAFAVSLWYLLSPATMLYENELFYTSFISLLLLMLVYFMLKFRSRSNYGTAAGLFISLTLLCLTRSVYHLSWLIPVCLLVSLSTFNKERFKILLAGSLLSICVVGGWYAKNYYLFHTFAASSWLGINFSRIVFHDVVVKDTSDIASVHPFFPVSYYNRYISQAKVKDYAGWNDKILLTEMKNGSFINMNHAAYLQVSDRYMESCKDFIIKHPGLYLANVFKSFIIFFSPASSYFKLAENNRKISYYDLVYSFNLSHLADTKEHQRITLAISAIPKFLVYCFVFFMVARKKYFSTINLVIIFTIFFSLAVSSLFEYGENMRYRYELEPLFLVLAAQVLSKMRPGKKEVY